MPGSVANATPVYVMPHSLFTAFVQNRVFPCLVNEYKNGESQRSVQAETSRKSWRVAKRLTPSKLATLLTFYEARKGQHQTFYIYDPFETSPMFSYDDTGVETTGRYTVRFDGPWEQLAQVPRTNLPLLITQVA